MSELKGWREIPIGGITWKSSLENKTGDWSPFKPKIDQNKCTKCLICWILCPDMAIGWDGEKIYEKYEYCKGCGICANECPIKCISMVKV